MREQINHVVYGLYLQAGTLSNLQKDIFFRTITLNMRKPRNIYQWQFYSFHLWHSPVSHVTCIVLVTKMWKKYFLNRESNNIIVLTSLPRCCSPCFQSSVPALVNKLRQFVIWRFPCPWGTADVVVPSTFSPLSRRTDDVAPCKMWDDVLKLGTSAKLKSFKLVAFTF